jgi:hypothetical protein
VVVGGAAGGRLAVRLLGAGARRRRSLIRAFPGRPSALDLVGAQDDRTPVFVTIQRSHDRVKRPLVRGGHGPRTGHVTVARSVGVPDRDRARTPVAGPAGAPDRAPASTPEVDSRISGAFRLDPGAGGVLLLLVGAGGPDADQDGLAGGCSLGFLGVLHAAARTLVRGRSRKLVQLAAGRVRRGRRLRGGGIGLPALGLVGGEEHSRHARQLAAQVPGRGRAQRDQHEPGAASRISSSTHSTSAPAAVSSPTRNTRKGARSAASPAVSPTR